MKETVLFRTMVELITNIQAMASLVMEGENDIFEVVEVLIDYVFV